MEQTDVNLQVEVQSLQGRGFTMDKEFKGRILACNPAGEGEAPITIELLRTGTQRFLTVSPSVFAVGYFLSDTLRPLSIRGSAFQLTQTVSYVAEIIAPGIFSGSHSIENLLQYEMNAIGLECQLSATCLEIDELKERMCTKEALCEEYGGLVGMCQTEVQQLKDESAATMHAHKAETAALRAKIRELRQESREKSVEVDHKRWELKDLKDQSAFIDNLSERNQYMIRLLQACPPGVVSKAEVAMRRSTNQGKPILYPASIFGEDDEDFRMDTEANPAAAIPLPASPPGDEARAVLDGRVSPLVFGAKAKRDEKPSTKDVPDKPARVSWQNAEIEDEGAGSQDRLNQETVMHFLAQNMALYPDAPAETLVNFSFQMSKLFQKSGLSITAQGRGRNPSKRRPSKSPARKTAMGPGEANARPQKVTQKKLSDIDRELRIGLGGPGKSTPAGTGAKPTKPTYAETARIDAESEWKTVRAKKGLANEKNLSLPSSRGTRVNELHLSIGTSDNAKRLSTKSGMDLAKEVTEAISVAATLAECFALKSNPIQGVKWSLRGNLIISCQNPLDDAMKESLKKGVGTFSSDQDDDQVAILNKLPTTLLKFMAISTVNPNGSPTSGADLMNDISAHPAWRDVRITEGPKFVAPRGKEIGMSAVVLIGVEDDMHGLMGKRLTNTLINFRCGPRTCQCWIVARGARQCTTCFKWGHAAFVCHSNTAVCSRCGGGHTLSTHLSQCASCKGGQGCTPKCSNCGGDHSATAFNCPFYKARFDDGAIRELHLQQRERRAQEAAGCITSQRPGIITTSA